MTTTELWEIIRSEIHEQITIEPALANFFSQRVLQHNDLNAAISDLLSLKLSTPDLPASKIQQIIGEALRADPSISSAITNDLKATRQRDPAVKFYTTAMLYFKGFQALQAYRVSHWLWQQERFSLALFLQSRIAEVFCVDIHPAAQIGSGILVDHATGIVIGETCVLEDNISIMHAVTLGGTGKECGDRHPKIRQGVLISAAATILGNVEIGEGAKVGAGSVVLNDVAAHTTVAGIPAVVVGKPSEKLPALDMDHELHIWD